MPIKARKTIGILLGLAICCTFARAVCPVDVVLVKGRTENGFPHARVRVELVYAKDVVGESGEATVEDGRFSISTQFLTQSRRPVVNGMLEKCSRRPKTVIVTLMESEGEKVHERVTLDFAKDFIMTDPSAYRLISELVLHGRDE